MKKNARKPARLPRRIVTTLGELIAAACEVAGPGQAQIDRAAALLTRSPLARAMSRHVEFVKA